MHWIAGNANRSGPAEYNGKVHGTRFNNTVGTLRGIFDLGLQNGLLADNPARLIRKVRVSGKAFDCRALNSSRRFWVTSSPQALGAHAPNSVAVLANQLLRVPPVTLFSPLAMLRLFTLPIFKPALT
jgi:hypothetical protein